MPAPQPLQYFADPNRKALRRALVDSEAESLAKEIRSIPASQIRRFYADVSAFERRLEGDPSLPDEAIQAQMGLLKAKAAYARRRNLIEQPLLQYFVNHAAKVKDRTDFDAFRRSFEAVIAYHKFHEEKKQRD